MRLFREGATYVAHVPELDISSCGDTEAETRRNIKDAVKGFLNTAEEQGRLVQILEEAGYRLEGGRWREPIELIKSCNLLRPLRLDHEAHLTPSLASMSISESVLNKSMRPRKRSLMRGCVTRRIVAASACFNLLDSTAF